VSQQIVWASRDSYKHENGDGYKAWQNPHEMHEENGRLKATKIGNLNVNMRTRKEST